MSKPELDTQLTPHLSHPILERQADEPQAGGAPALQQDPLAGVACRLGDASCAGGHASQLNRATAAQPSRGGGSLIRLQKEYGNRFVQRVLAQAKSEADAEATPDIEGAIQRARGGGQALDSGTRAGMESSFGADFSGVRVHADAGTDTLNRSLNARAFTTGQDIFFKQGEYSPGSSGGRELLAHELTHVVQQNGDQVQTKLTVGQPGDRYEQEADRVARAITQPEPDRVQRETDERLVQRQVEEEEKEEEEPVQAKAEEAWIQRQEAPPEEEEEEEPVQAKAADSWIQQQVKAGSSPQ
jgi:hypothetical protein